MKTFVHVLFDIQLYDLYNLKNIYNLNFKKTFTWLKIQIAQRGIH